MRSSILPAYSLGTSICNPPLIASSTCVLQGLLHVLLGLLHVLLMGLLHVLLGLLHVLLHMSRVVMVAVNWQPLPACSTAYLLAMHPPHQLKLEYASMVQGFKALISCYKLQNLFYGQQQTRERDAATKQYADTSFCEQNSKIKTINPHPTCIMQYGFKILC